MKSYIMIGEEEGHSKKQRPEGRDLPEMVMPEMGHQEGTQGYGQKDSGKGKYRPDGQLCSDIMYAMGCRFCRNSGTGKNKVDQRVNQEKCQHT